LPVSKILATKHQSDLIAYCEKLFSDKKILFETKLITKTGEKLPVEISSLIFNLQGKTFVLCVARDISERKRAEEERLKVERLQGVIEMSGAVCHEVNQPLQIISGLADLLSLNSQESDPNYNEHSQIYRDIKSEIQRMAEMNKKIMKITKYETKEYLDRKIIDIDKSSK
jgi:signal transduction histidine kinase